MAVWALRSVHTKLISPNHLNEVRFQLKVLRVEMSFYEVENGALGEQRRTHLAKELFIMFGHLVSFSANPS